MLRECQGLCFFNLYRKTIAATYLFRPKIQWISFSMDIIYVS